LEDHPLSAVRDCLFIFAATWRASPSWEEKRNAYRILVGKPKGKRPLGRSRRRWVANIKMDVREIRRGGMD
jgi:hypothetical protein